MLRPLFLISFVFYHLLLVMINMTVWSCHVTYAFQSESTPYYSLNVKELLARSRREIRSLSDCNWNRTQNHLVRKQTFNHLAKVTKLVLGSSPVAVTYVKWGQYPTACHGKWRFFTLTFNPLTLIRLGDPKHPPGIFAL